MCFLYMGYLNQFFEEKLAAGTAASIYEHVYTLSLLFTMTGEQLFYAAKISKQRGDFLHSTCGFIP